MSAAPSAVLETHFGFSEFRDGQEAVIRTLLEGRPALAVFPTGGGKSLCYQLPALLLDGLTLVVSPLIALMKDQVDALRGRGIAAARLDSSLGTGEALALYDSLRRDELKLLYIAPERLANEKFRARLTDLDIALLAIDEAHCISEWGHNFRPDYLKLAGFARELGIGRVLALTATATPRVAADIRSAFGVAETDQVQLSFHRPNLRLQVTPIHEADKRQYLLSLLKRPPGSPDSQIHESTIIYGTRQETAESLAAFLKREGLPARPYHAGLRPETRDACQEAFMSGEAPVITATIAFGMGIDKADIRRIIHYNLPKSLENFTQEIGRAGRDGKPASCELFACADDLRVLENFIYGDTPSPQSIRRALDQILRAGDEFDLSLYELSGANDIRQLVVNTLLTYLELDGYLEATSPFYTTYKVKLLRPLGQVLLGYDSGERVFLERLFATGKAGRLWTAIVIEETATALDTDRANIIRSLTELETHGEVVLQPSGVRQGYRRLREPDNLAALTDRLQQLFLRREQQDLNRLQQILAYAETPGCLNQHLLAHFGEAMANPCGHCANCKRQDQGSKIQDPRPATPLPGTTPPGIASGDLESIQSLALQRHAPLRTPRQLARFLCGLGSPATTRAWVTAAGSKRKMRLTSHEAFGLLRGHPFADVLAHCETLIIP